MRNDESIQQRRVYRNRSADHAGLPLTGHDLQSSSTATHRTRQKHNDRDRYRGRGLAAGNDWLRLIACSTSVIIFIGMILLATSKVASQSHNTRVLQGPSAHSLNSPKNEDNMLPLSEYSSLQPALQRSSMVGLYFAAKWCRISTRVTEQMNEYLIDHLVMEPYLSNDAQFENEKFAKHKSQMSLVYISSDRSEEDMNDYLNNHGQSWSAVPWHSLERTKLKKHFHVCSTPEVESLQMFGSENRQHEIPSLLIIDSKSQTVLTKHGVEDLHDYGKHAFDHWVDLQHLVRAMEDKYNDEWDDVSHSKKASSLLHQRHHGLQHIDSYSSLFA